MAYTFVLKKTPAIPYEENVVLHDEIKLLFHYSSNPYLHGGYAVRPPPSPGCFFALYSNLKILDFNQLILADVLIKKKIQKSSLPPLRGLLFLDVEITHALEG